MQAKTLVQELCDTPHYIHLAALRHQHWTFQSSLPTKQPSSFRPIETSMGSEPRRWKLNVEEFTTAKTARWDTFLTMGEFGMQTIIL